MAERAQLHRDRIEEDDLDVEEDEQHRHHVEADAEAEALLDLRGQAALVGLRVAGDRRRPNLAKEEPYECGLPTHITKTFRFGISFYMVAMLFILFDIEVVFLYPIAVQLRSFGTFAMTETIVFIVLLAIAFVYVWRRGALNWR